MKLFKCQNCGQVLYFENRWCETCHSQVGYLPAESALLALIQVGSTRHRGRVWEVRGESGNQYRLCANAGYDACNWLVAAESSADFCLACSHNRIIPDVSVPDNLANWRLYELAKHRLFYTLIALGLPLRNRVDDPERGLAFDFLAETAEKPRVITGHEDGLITLNLKEADDAYRARERLRLGEPCRTLLGHFRHESGHYYWDRLVAGAHRERFRELFGDERRDYAEALRAYYAKGPLRDWRSNYISAYASAHPWEDFAETWAHYLHIVDTMEMALSFGVTIREAPRSLAGFRGFIDEWLSLTVFMNSINRCMGSADLYPFVISPAVIPKLEFIHLLAGPDRAAMDAELLTVTA